MAKTNMNQKRGFAKINSRAQVTIFIIIAILIVGIILFFYYYVGPNFIYTGAQKPALERCIEKELSIQINKLSLTAGIVNPAFTSMYLDDNYTFICYTNEYYKPCAVQYPFLKETFEKSLITSMKPKVQDCYDSAIDELISEGNDITPGTIKSNISITPDGVRILIDAPTAVSIDGASASFRNFEVNIPSQVYNVLMIANSILQFESSYGDSEVSSFMFYYPDLNIQKIRRDDNVKLYIITDKKDIKYRFASRSYAWPPGYGNSFS